MENAKQREVVFTVEDPLQKRGEQRGRGTRETEDPHGLSPLFAPGWVE
jgi:hypothetical protein